ncbi:LysR family transcriptional regulator [Glycomyces harbinensis]|uniref:DNA-binding transcriptional regulator, LysR family n=1 Tax=Glycomyces harbinensis TaxID=58114 RepID=A0A1G6ZMC6_9ACTN|nr:LysR family transcriptional regulator [Glycomyces harbinensis]SDE03642.1 DNA-binding transcriptional regulator, LysR family [Glycomyces harbinensis]
MTEIYLRQLATMAAIAEEGTFSRAANRLGYTQSSVSQHVAALEKAVGGPVFERPGGPRPVRITPLGAVVLEHGRGLLSKAEALEDAVERFKAGDGRVDIGTLQSVANAILPAVVHRLKEEHPGCEIRLSEKDQEEASIGELDLLFFDGPIDEDTEQVLLLEDPYLVVARPGELPPGPARATSLDGRATVAWPATCDQSRMEQALADAGVLPRIVFRSAGNETILSMVRAGLGLAVLPWLAIHHVVCRTCGDIHGYYAGADLPLQVHELVPAPKREIRLHWPRGHAERSPLTARTIAIAAEVARELAGQLPSSDNPRGTASHLPER